MKKDCLIRQRNLKHISGIVGANHDGKYKVKDNWLGLPTQTSLEADQMLLAAKESMRTVEWTCT